MAGHSKFKNIMHRKGRQDAVRSKMFAKLSKEITVASKLGGPDPDGNPRLRLAIQNAKGIFVGGGNTFLLLDTLYKNDFVETIKEVVTNGVPYLGTSAGSNIAGVNVRNTNDMPIIYPPSFDAMGLIPFNINPHYLDPIEGSTHMGETRETRINEFHAHAENDLAVLGIREGSWIRVKGDAITLGGELTARLFKKEQPPIELATGSDLTGL